MRLSRKEIVPNKGDLPAADVVIRPAISTRIPAEPKLPKTYIGSKIQLKGVLTGSEDIVVEGSVEGSIELNEHSVSIGPKAVIQANTKGKTVSVEGTLEGDIEASALITVKQPSQVTGTLKAERVIIEDGAKFQGGIAMTVKS